MKIATPPGAEKFVRMEAFEPEQKPAGNGPDLGAAKRVIDTKAPYATAKLFLDGFVTREIRPLHHHRGGFYQWNGSAYPEVSESELRAQLYTFLDQSFAEGREGDLRQVKPNQAMVTNVLDGLRAASHLDSKIAAPAWLNAGSNRPASEIVACTNGLLHLPTREMFPGTPDFFTYNALDFAFDRNAPEPNLWIEFLHQLWPDDPETVSTLQEIFGYCLTQDTRQQKAFLLIGPKRSGKGTIARILARLVGAANAVAPTLAALGMNFGLAPLIGKRVAIISDARLGATADQHAIAERLLSITGEDAITIDRKYAAAWTGQLQTRFLVISNLFPQLADASGALASRFIVLMLKNSFYGREDHALTAKLIPQLPGILNWAIAGWHRLTKFGYFQQPESALQAVQAFEDLGSPIGAFLRERCETGPGYSGSVSQMFEAWTNWCKEQGRDHPGTAQRFGRDLRAACPGIRTVQPRDGEDRCRLYEGIRVKE